MSFRFLIEKLKLNENFFLALFLKYFVPFHWKKKASLLPQQSKILICYFLISLIFYIVIFLWI